MDPYYPKFNIDTVMEAIYNCNETGKVDFSQNKLLVYKYWSLDKVEKLNSKIVKSHISINGIQQGGTTINCRVKIEFKFTRGDLEKLEFNANNAGMTYRGTQEYPQKEISLIFENNIYKLPVKLNNNLTLDFILDLGASDVSISQDVFSVLVKTGSITETDFIGDQTYQLADGTTTKSKVFNLRSLKIGGIEIQNVRTSISNSIKSPLLLGQSALIKLGKYKIDNTKSVLTIE